MQSLLRLRAAAATAAAAAPRRCASSASAGADTAALSAALTAECAALAAGGGRIAWVLLGAPGVGKGTYASRVAALMGVPHVSTGDLVRDEIKAATPLAKQARRASCVVRCAKRVRARLATAAG
jgi:adenylate kinase